MIHLISMIVVFIQTSREDFIGCGFGVGLSWGTVAFTSDNMVVSELVEVDDSLADQGWV